MLVNVPPVFCWRAEKSARPPHYDELWNTSDHVWMKFNLWFFRLSVETKQKSEDVTYFLIFYMKITQSEKQSTDHLIFKIIVKMDHYRKNIKRLNNQNANRI